MGKKWQRGCLRKVGLLQAICLCAILASCGGPTALTGGSVPIGTSRLQGIVVRAEDVTRSVPDTQLTLTRNPYQSLRNSDSQGHFDFGNIIDGYFTCAVKPPSGSGLGENWAWRFYLPPNTNAYLVAAIWPSSFDPTSVRRLTLQPGSITLRPGDSVRFISTAYDQNDNPIPLSMSFLLEGDIGTLSPDGTFQATKAGRGRISIWVTNHTVSADIFVQQ